MKFENRTQVNFISWSMLSQDTPMHVNNCENFIIFLQPNQFMGTQLKLYQQITFVNNVLFVI